MLEVVIFIVCVCAHLMNTVDAVPHSSVEVSLLVCGEALGGVLTDTGHKLTPGTGEQHIADMVNVLICCREDILGILQKRICKFYAVAQRLRAAVKETIVTGYARYGAQS